MSKANTVFIEGLIAQPPHANAPEYVKSKLWIKRLELIAWLQAQTGESINAEVKESQGGKWYVAVDDWKPDSASAPRSAPRNDPNEGRHPPTHPSAPRREAPPAAFDDDDIPF